MTKINLKFIIDVALWGLSGPVAFWLRLEQPLQNHGNAILFYILLALPLKACFAYGFGLHRQNWRKIAVRDLLTLIKAVGLATLVLSLLILVLGPHLAIPRSVPLLAGMVGFLLLAGVRLGTRLWDEGKRSHSARGQRVLVVGAGEAGTMITREMQRHPETGLQPVGFLDDDPAKQRTSIGGLPVLGSLDRLPEVARTTGADEVLIAIPSAPGRVVRKATEAARQAGIRCRTIPGVFEILSGRVSISQLREVTLEDLLRRKPVKLDLAEIATFIEGRVLLVTGAGGSIGSELVRQVARFSPKQVILLGAGENSLFEIERELERTWPELDYRVVLANVREAEQVEHVFRNYHPQVVLHAAAHKHVPLMELQPDQAVLNNVLGTQNLVKQALGYRIERFVNISTDKAVNPTSAMGASKRIAEQLVSWANRQAAPGQVFVSVRFGNVLGSRGSVVPLFQKQIRLGGPVTVTHPEMTRYFMTIPEAAQLVLQAAGLGQNGCVYVLDMGEPVKILDLAQDLIRLSGLEPGIDIEIVFTGIRPGEKLCEELLTAEEGSMASKHERIYIARDPGLPSHFEEQLEALFAAARRKDQAAIHRTIKELVPTYHSKLVR